MAYGALALAGWPSCSVLATRRSLMLLDAQQLETYVRQGETATPQPALAPSSWTDPRRHHAVTSIFHTPTLVLQARRPRLWVWFAPRLLQLER